MNHESPTAPLCIDTPRMRRKTARERLAAAREDPFGSFAAAATCTAAS